MMEYKKILVPLDMPIEKAIEVLDKGSMQLVLVVDADNRLRGTVTDGDVRRAILKHIRFDIPVSEIMNSAPYTAHISASREELVEAMLHRSFKHIPLLDDDGRVAGLSLLDEMFKTPSIENMAFIMAGGLGSRLRPLTDEVPKPMLKVGNKPILETILGQLRACGFHKAMLCVNHKAEVIRDYFSDGKKVAIDIEYLLESEKLGTAGALGLLPRIPEQPVLVMNGDILTKVNFNHLLDFHKKGGHDATVCIKQIEYGIPYGVVKVENQRIVEIQEKPRMHYFIAAGIYILSPSAIELIEKGKFLDMPHLIQKMIGLGKSVGSFPIHEYWIDIGQISDYNLAVMEHDKHFR